MKSFLIPVGQRAGASLPTLFSALSCGAAHPVTGLDIFHIADSESDPLIPSLAEDLNRMHTLLKHGDNASLFPSSFVYQSFRPQLPSVLSLSADPSSAALLGALRGKGVPLSYKTDREAVEWAFSVLLSSDPEGTTAPMRSWFEKISACVSSAEEYRVAILCDPADPFSAGASFALLRWLSKTVKADPSCLTLFCIGTGSLNAAGPESDCFASSVRALAEQDLAGRPDRPGTACADAVWLLFMPASMLRSPESIRLLYTVLARCLARFFTASKVPAPGLHTVTLPGILTLQSLGEEAKPFAAFMHTSAWLLADLFPSLSSACDRQGALRSLARNSRSGFFRRLVSRQNSPEELRDNLARVRRAFSAVLSEILSTLRFLPDQMRLAVVSDPLWQKVVDACGKTVTVASEYDVSRAEAEEAGVLDVRPVHRVSMADTEEEKAGRRLEDIAAQLKEETDKRDDLFKTVGGCWAFLALHNCRRRCRDALEKAQARQAAILSEASGDHLAEASIARRIRLLEAAIARCDRDISDPSLSARLESETPSSLEGLTSFSSLLFDPSAAEKLSVLISPSVESSEASKKELISLLPSLFPGFALSDAKQLFRQLQAVSSPDTADNPLSELCLSALDVSAAELRPIRLVSAGEVPALPLLPDLYPAGPLLTVDSLLPLLPGSAGEDPVPSRRALLALLLLRQYRRRASDEASLSVVKYQSGDSPVLNAWLAAHGTDSVYICSLEKEDISLPFALFVPGAALLPARLTAAHSSLLPVFASPWFDEETLSFRDPCGILCEGDRTILLEQLDRMIKAAPEEGSEALVSFLTAFFKDLDPVHLSSALPDHLELRLKAAYGLRMLPAFSGTLLRTPCFYERFLSSDAVAAALLGRPAFTASPCSVPDDILFLYRDVPFARENSRTLLEAIPLPAEKWILSLLDRECDILSGASDDYHEHLMRELGILLERYPDALPEAREAASALMEKAAKPVTSPDTELTWPWDPKSPSVLTILTECLGEDLASAALQPFSDLLTLFPARGREIIGDALMSAMCVLPPRPVAAVPEDPDAEQDPEEQAQPREVPADSVLPPLSPSLCNALCRLPEGKTMIRPGLLSFDHAENNAVKVTLLLEGSFDVRLIRVYSEEEIVRLYAHDIPTLSVWPDLPFDPEDWKAYFIYSSLPAGFSISAGTADGSIVTTSEDAERSVRRSASFPLAFSLFRGSQSAGAVPNILPRPEIRHDDTVTACVDFGSVGTSVVFSVGHQRRPMQGPTLVRTLITNPARSRDLLRREFLPAVPVSALLPTASRIFRNIPGESPMPFEDGIVLMSSDLQDVLSIPSGSLYTCLKWEEEKGRSVSLCLHQIMLMAALQARSDGAAVLCWRFSVPDEMARTGRERLAALFTELANQVCLESGFPVPKNVPLVTFAAESSALGAYFRLCASEDTRGGFMVLDIGACTADISLFLRGREQAVRTCQIPMGIHYMLLPSLLRDPGMLRQDLGYIQDPAFQQDLSMLEKTLCDAKADIAALRHSRLALDSFIADRFISLMPALLQNPSTGMPTRTGSILLLHFSYLMMLSGLILLQIAADPGKNDFLPEQMSLCLSGRGSILPECLPDPYKTALWHFLTMFRNRRVASLSFLFSSEKKMEIPVGLSVLEEVSAGLPAASMVPAAISVRPEELLPEFILRFAKEFPSSAELLFHGFYTGDFYHPFTPYGESVITRAIAQSFTDRTALLPYDALAAWISSLLDLLHEPVV